mmetsp:Transcript_34892/g.107997  ORF Transcript_34892/g.107997 Transcript_34892/m.107997 type:complete len:341 (+) Transcript_34892:42-1064(+)
MMRSACLLVALVASVRADDSTVTLSNGVVMPMAAAGTWQYNASEAEASVAAALEAGFRHIDTANDYGNQDGVSKGLAAGAAATGLKRDDIFITTKVPGCGVQGVDSKDCQGSTAQFLDDNIELLGSAYPDFGGYADLVLLHFPPCTKGIEGEMTWCNTHRQEACSECDNIKAQWTAMLDAYAAGKYKAIGVSNYCDVCLACLDGVATFPMVNQIQLHVGMGKDPQGMVAMNAKLGIVTQAWSPLGSGGHGSDDILSGNLTTGIAAAHNVSTAQVALKYLVDKGAAIVTKSSNPEHLAEDVDLWSWDLTADEIAALDDDSAAAGDAPSFECDNQASLALAV